MSKKCDWLDISSLVISGVHTIVQQCNSVPTWRRCCCIADHSEKQLKKVELIFFLCVIPFHMWEEHSAHRHSTLVLLQHSYVIPKPKKGGNRIAHSQIIGASKEEKPELSQSKSGHAIVNTSLYSLTLSHFQSAHITIRNIVKSTNWNNGISLTGPPQPSTPDQTDLIHDDIWFGNGRSHAQGSSCFQPLRTSSSHARTTPEGKRCSQNVFCPECA